MKMKMMVLMSVLALMMAGASGAAVMYSEDFTGPDGAVPTDWTIHRGTAQISNNRLFVGPTADNTSSWNRAKYDGAGSDAWQNYSVSVDWMTPRNLATGGSSSLYPGFYVYASNHPTDPLLITGYLLRWRDTSYSSHNRLYISKDIPGAIHDLAFVTMPDWAASEWYNMDVVIQNQPDMSVTIDVVLTRISDGQVIGTVSAVDDGSSGGSPYYAGTVGVVSIFSYSSTAQDRYAEFDNLVVVPEPITLGLMALGGAFALRRRR